MCIAILTGPGRVVSEDTFRRCWENNSHGFGMAYNNPYHGKKVDTDKGYMNVEAALKAYQRMAEYAGKDNPMLLHFRAATVGTVNAANCHPFKVRGGAMIHNGTFFRDARMDKSDSRHVAETMHNELTYENLTANKKAFDDAFGYNRVAFLYAKGKYVIFSEDYEKMAGKYGQWHDGIWYSNGGWRGDYGEYYGNGVKPVDDVPVMNDDVGLAELDKALERMKHKI